MTDLPDRRQPARKTRFWKWEYRPGGWVRLHAAATEAPSGFRGRVFLQLQPSDDPGGRLLVHRAFMAGDVPISARTWRQVPFAEVEAQASNIEPLEVLSRPAEIDTEVIEELDRYFDETKATYPDVDFIPEMPAHPWRDLPQSDASYSPIRPPDGRITDEFLQQVAAAYHRATAEERSPGPAIAQEARVPVRTVHGWISRARKRGYLPPGRTGRAG